MSTRQENLAQLRKYGQYPTPRWIVDLMLHILKPKPDAVAVDPGRGTSVINPTTTVEPPPAPEPQQPRMLINPSLAEDEDE